MIYWQSPLGFPQLSLITGLPMYLRYAKEEAPECYRMSEGYFSFLCYTCTLVYLYFFIYHYRFLHQCHTILNEAFKGKVDHSVLCFLKQWMVAPIRLGEWFMNNQQLLEGEGNLISKIGEVVEKAICEIKKVPTSITRFYFTHRVDN